MGYRGKVEERQRACELRAESWTLADIAAELGVAKSSVSIWVRHIDFTPRTRKAGRRRGPNKLQRAKAAEIANLQRHGIEQIGNLSDREFLMAGLGLYAGDGAKTGSSVHFANSNPALIEIFCKWFRRFFDVDESRLHVTLYLHEHLDLDAAVEHWSTITGVPVEQFNKPYRAAVDETMRYNKHVHGCCHVRYHSARELRRILGLIDGLILISSTSVSPG